MSAGVSRCSPMGERLKVCSQWDISGRFRAEVLRAACCVNAWREPWARWGGARNGDGYGTGKSREPAGWKACATGPPD